MANEMGFVGAQMDRADHIRGDQNALNAGLKQAKTVVFWRSRPLVSADYSEMALLPLGHKLIAGRPPEVFLGRINDTHIYAVDISDWQPHTQPHTQENALFDQTETLHPDADTGDVFTDARFAMGAFRDEFAEMAAVAKAMNHWHRANGFCGKCGGETFAQKAGWQRTCSQCDQSHFPRLDPSVIMLVTHGNSALLGRSPGWPEKMYSCLAGFMEPGETIEMAVRREVMEEASVKVSNVRYLLSQPWPFSQLADDRLCGRSQNHQNHP